MCKRVALIGVLILLTLSVSACADEFSYGWGWIGSTRGGATVEQDCLDSFDIHDHLARPIGGWEGGAYYANGQDGWDGDTGFYATDARAPLMPGATKTWLFYFWAVPGPTPTDGGFNWGLVRSAAF